MKNILLFLISSMFFGCAATALERYDGKVYSPTVECKVKTLHDIEYAKYYIETELKDYVFMGTSNFRIDEDYFYTEKEAKNDCMKIGADLVIVINLGVVDSYSGQINYINYTENITGYRVLFFKR